MRWKKEKVDLMKEIMKKKFEGIIKRGEKSPEKPIRVKRSPNSKRIGEDLSRRERVRRSIEVEDKGDERELNEEVGEEEEGESNEVREERNEAIAN